MRDQAFSVIDSFLQRLKRVSDDPERLTELGKSSGYALLCYRGRVLAYQCLRSKDGDVHVPLCTAVI